MKHLGSCGSCGARYHAAQAQRNALQSMESPEVPLALQARLRVIASHDRERRLRQVSFISWLRHWSDRLQLAFENMARPFAIPAAGGLLTAIVLLGMWGPLLAPVRDNNDVPLPYWVYTGPSPRGVNELSSVSNAVVELTIDERGRVADCSVTHGELSPELTGSILVWRFTPATLFGQPARGKLVYRLSQVSVRG